MVAVSYDLRGAAVRQPAEDNKSNNFDGIAIWLESRTPSPRTASVAPVTAVMEQQDRHFVPGLLILPVGSVVNFPNQDPIFHNIFSLSKTQTFDLGYYPKGKSRTVTFSHPGIVQVYCHVHPNMYGVIVVTSSPWFGKPESNGSFSWTDVPAGSYRLMIWQRFAGLFHRDLTVPESGSVAVRIAIPEQRGDH